MRQQPARQLYRMRAMDATLVWLKRDLRLRDPASLHAAQGARAAAAVYVIEPDWLASAEFSSSHLQITLQCLAELRSALAARGLPLLVRVGAVPAVFDALQRRFPFTQLLSHEETGPGWTRARDLEVAAWCRARGVAWQAVPQTAVVRRLRGRAGWAGRWARRKDAPALPAPSVFHGAAAFSLADLPDLPTPAALGVAPPWQALQPVGEDAAWSTLAGFLAGRGPSSARPTTRRPSSTSALR